MHIEFIKHDHTTDNTTLRRGWLVQVTSISYLSRYTDD